MGVSNQVQILGVIAPEFATQASTRTNVFLQLAGLTVNPNIFGLKTDAATAYLAAHMMTISTRKGNTGVAMEKVDMLERQYQPLTANSNDPELEQTAYGMEFLRLRRSLLITPILV